MDDLPREFPDKPIYHSDELCHYFGMAFNTLRGKVGNEPGQLRAIKFHNKSYLVLRESLIEWLRDKEIQP